MASGGAKNIGLIVIAVVAIGGAAYLLSQSMSGGGTVDLNEKIYFVKNDTINDEQPVGITMTMREYNSRIKNRNPIEIDGSLEVTRAGKCPEGKFYPLDGHAAPPPTCPCGNSLEGVDLHGNRAAG